jgi:hypothetical protein
MTWTHKGRLLVVWNTNLRWNYWNFGDIHPTTKVWVSRGRVKGYEAAKRAAEAIVDGDDATNASPSGPGIRQRRN